MRLTQRGYLLLPLLIGPACSDPSTASDLPSVKPRSDGPSVDRTTKAGQSYIDYCEDEYGLSIPPTLLDPSDGPPVQWRLHGILENPFIQAQLDAELWSYQKNNDSNNQFCLAIARKSGSSRIESLGMICMSETGHTCFFSNDPDYPDELHTPAPDPNEPYETAEVMLGGFDLIGNPEGVCSDCHIGENPFVVHPQDPAFVDALNLLNFFPDSWPTPVIPDHAEWPANPSAIESLAPTDGASCSRFGCHEFGEPGGRLPLVSTEYPGYCSMVLRSAVGENPNGILTMPPSPEDPTHSADHVDWMLGACEIQPGQGQIVRFRPPSQVPVLAPFVEDPYACTRFVTVRSALLGAELTLSVDGVPIATGTMSDPQIHVFELAAELDLGKEIEVTQRVGTLVSPPGVATVKHYEEDYEDLPAPQILPAPIYECATAIALSNVPGARITVEKTESSGEVVVKSMSSGRGRTWMTLNSNGPFDVGDKFTATQEICGDVSPVSSLVTVVESPVDRPEVEFDAPIVGQRFLELKSILHGSRVTLDELPSLTVRDIPSVPLRRLRLDLLDTPLGLVSPGDQLVARQELCSVASSGSHPTSAVACDPMTLVPTIAHPQNGDNFVLVTDSVLGATIRVFGQEPTNTLVELGNGTGDLIAVSRPLSKGETITVSQSLEGCTPYQAYSIVVK